MSSQCFVPYKQTERDTNHFFRKQIQQTNFHVYLQIVNIHKFNLHRNLIQTFPLVVALL